MLCPFPWCEDELQLKLSNIFTRLQIVRRKKERSKLTSDTVNMTDVFKPRPECHSPRVVLIEGNPGMGKTTYCKKLAYDWSVGEIPPDASFPEVKILLLLKCRDMHMKTANIEEAIEDQLLPEDAGKKEKEDFLQFIRSNQSRILLVLDGLDEMREDLVQGFLPLIQGRVFANVYLMLTARHKAGIKVRRYCDVLFEIVGYNYNDVKSYIKKYFSSHEDQSLADKLIEQLKEDRSLRALTVNPLNTALLCLLCEETGGVFFSTRTKMYDGLVSCALRRHFAKTGISLGDDDPMERCSKALIQMGKIAFETLLRTQLHFSQDEVKSQSTLDFLRLPFFSLELSVSKIRPTPCYSFTHKTFQEYFAALYLTHQLLSGEEGKERLLDELSPIDNWQVWEFLITMVSSKSAEAAINVVSRLCAFLCRQRSQRLIDDDVDVIVEIPEEKPYYWDRNLMRWGSNEHTLNDVVRKTLDLIVECEDGDNELKDYQRKMVHVLARCFPLEKMVLPLSASTFSVDTEYLKFNDSLTDLRIDGDLDLLLAATIVHVFNFKEKLVHFSLLNEKMLDMPPPVANPMHLFFSRKMLVAEVFQPGSFLTQIKMRAVWISDEGCQSVAEFLQTNRSLTHLSLRFAMISNRGAEALGNALQSNCTLTHLSLPENKISGVGAAALSTGLQSNSVLMYLDLSWNVDGDSIAMALASALESNCALRCLFVKDMIGPRGFLALARALRCNRTLTCLGLGFIAIDDSGEETLGEALQSISTLKELHVTCSSIGDTNAAAIAKLLQSSGILMTHLDLRCSRITCLGAITIAEALHTNSSLTHLCLYDNKIGCFGALAFAKALKANRSLTHLDLSRNHIDDFGAVALADALKNDNIILVYLDLSYNHAVGSVGKESFEQIDRPRYFVKF